MTRYVYFILWDDVWRISRRNWKRFLQHVASGAQWNVEDFRAKRIGETSSITDLDAETAAGMLEDLP